MCHIPTTVESNESLTVLNSTVTPNEALLTAGNMTAFRHLKPAGDFHCENECVVNAILQHRGFGYCSNESANNVYLVQIRIRYEQ